MMLRGLHVITAIRFSDRLAEIKRAAAHGTATSRHTLAVPVHRAGVLHSVCERISMVNSYVGLDTAIDDQSRSKDLVHVDDPAVLYTEWARMAAWRTKGASPT